MLFSLFPYSSMLSEDYVAILYVFEKRTQQLSTTEDGLAFPAHLHLCRRGL